MSKSGSGSVVSLDELPVMGRPDSKDYILGLRDYVTSMKELVPGDPRHPTDDWLNRGLQLFCWTRPRKLPLLPSKAPQVPGEQKLGVLLPARSPPRDGT